MMKKGGRSVNQHQEENREKLKDILCILSLLETDMEQQKGQEIYLRVVKHIHRIIQEVEV